MSSVRYIVIGKEVKVLYVFLIVFWYDDIEFELDFDKEKVLVK